MNKRFTINGSDALEQHLQCVCAKVLAGIRRVVADRNLQAIFLGGGYGRGEGGVLKTESGDKPYNDLEFYVCVRGNNILNEIKYRRAVHHLAEELTPQAGIEVELKLTSFEKMKAGPPSMFLYDLALGHRTIFGDPGLFSERKFRDESEIPLSEATRLLMNRCTGLLFSQKRLRAESFSQEDADFVGRNQAKAQLAFGDALLVALRQYHWSVRERNARLKKMTESRDPVLASSGLAVPQILCHHSAGLEFKLHPQRKTGVGKNFLPLQIELCQQGLQLWLWLESRRLQQNFHSVSDYALSSINKCPETNATRNRLVNLKAFGPSIYLNGPTEIYPRQRLLHTLPFLLWEPNSLTNPALLQFVQTELRTQAKTFPSLVDAYEALWKRFQ